MRSYGIFVISSVLSLLIIGTILTTVEALRAVVAYLPTADASQGPRYITFDSIGDCHKYVKQNSGLYNKSDCQKGVPPEEPPTEP